MAVRQARSLVCPGCGERSPSERRFCDRCRLPLVLDEAEDDRSRSWSRSRAERHARARKIKPQLAEGELVRVAWAQNETEAEFIQSLLLEEGVPSVVRRSAGFDVPDLLAAGPRDVLVAHSGLDTAREVLLQSDVIGAGDSSRSAVAPGRLLAGLVVALALGALVIWLLAQVPH